VLARGRPGWVGSTHERWSCRRTVAAQAVSALVVSSRLHLRVLALLILIRFAALMRRRWPRCLLGGRNKLLSRAPCTQHSPSSATRSAASVQIVGVAALRSVEIRVRQDGLETARRRHFLRPPFEDYFEVCTRRPRGVKSQLQLLAQLRQSMGDAPIHASARRGETALTLCWRSAATLPPISIEAAYGRSVCCE
jgi:hypothetical protein